MTPGAMAAAGIMSSCGIGGTWSGNSTGDNRAETVPTGLFG